MRRDRVGTSAKAASSRTLSAPAEAFRNAYGYFSDDGREYIITRPDTPRPWINVISNGSYGLLVSQTGGGFSWWEDANLARLTRWVQDLIQDEWGKYLYILDEESGQCWSASWKPVCAGFDRYEVHHGIGYTTFVQQRDGIETRWTLFVPPDDPCEVWRVEIRNTGSTSRRLSLFSYVEWCLGNGLDWHREFHKTFLETLYLKDLQALVGIKRRLPVPPYISTGLTEWSLSGFHAASRPPASYEGDKEAFLGRYGRLQQPQAVRAGKLSNTLGRWNDSIASLHVQLTLEPGQQETVIFLLGKHDSREATETLIHRYARVDQVAQAFQRLQHFWRPSLSNLLVETPDAAFNLMTNTWLKYQAISCRLWARAAYYQSSGAYGYRDQLQDSQVFLPLAPELTKRQILLHARHQFKDGTVYHWWHPLLEAGPRTGKTDDLLWLVFVTLSYLDETDDPAILAEQAPFLDGGAGSLFDHCTRSIEKVLSRLSKRGLPLIGEGDWNDGLSAVGVQWKGESIWLGHFLYGLLVRWAGWLERLLAKRVGLPGASPARLRQLRRRYLQRAKALRQAINRYGWDGQWYWRASRDDGQLIGSRKNREGRIYLNAQTWAVIAGTATPQRTKTAMAQVERLLDQAYGPLLLTPAYTQPDNGIGYLSRYAPGTRENGGVYSHAACWAILAECLLGRAEIAWRMYAKICPPRRGMDPELYYVEPYVMPGNSDGPESPHFGRGGWTWYTGSAAWLFRVSTEWLLGVRPTAEGLVIDPCLPASWDGFRMKRIFRGTTYELSIENPRHVNTGVRDVWLDGKRLARPVVPALGDGQVHYVRVVMGQ